MDIGYNNLGPRTDMTMMRRIKNRALARAVTRHKALSRVFTDAYKPLEFDDIPWTLPGKPLCDSKVAIITTAGLHHREQMPFNMQDTDGDPTFRVIDATRPLEDIMITHDYYDHRDADKDINVVFPVERLRELEKEGLVGEVSPLNIGFMGHVTGPHIKALIRETAPEAARLLRDEGVDAVLLTPG
jgi:D-proline reductase (dithiol) PrdB